MRRFLPHGTTTLSELTAPAQGTFLLEVSDAVEFGKQGYAGCAVNRREFIARAAALGASIAASMQAPSLFSRFIEPVRRQPDILTPARSMLFFRSVGPNGELGEPIELGTVTDIKFTEEPTELRSTRAGRVKEWPVSAAGTIQFTIPYDELSPEVRAVLGLGS